MRPFAVEGGEPSVRVGLQEGPAFSVRFEGPWHGAEGRMRLDASAAGRRFTPAGEGARFVVEGMRFGLGFHWEQAEDMAFGGALEVVDVGRGRVALVNEVGVETYLTSVISSEMSSMAMPALLRAHAVISRSWLLRNMGLGCPANDVSQGRVESADEVVRWYDHDDHQHYDVCADDHCQRYQGLTRIVRREAGEAVEATRGLVLLAPDGTLADARFSKCCGGAMEEFGACWADEPHSYLQARRDRVPPLPVPDLRLEPESRRWIMGQPEAFCARPSAEVLAQVLNGFDLESTPDFYRWKVNYTADELASLLRRRSGIDFGEVVALEPLERGRSGRIMRLRIVGTRRTMVVGKELEIRKWLSESHLYSSAFVAEPHWRDDEKKENGGVPSAWTLHGAGWGHGVGLCQIGAAVMASQGYGFEQILAHYYPGASLSSIYR